jgi:hypothetical protein
VNLAWLCGLEQFGFDEHGFFRFRGGVEENEAGLGTYFDHQLAA